MNDQGFPQYLRAAMKAAGFTTAAELNRAIGVGESQISRWLRGQNVPEIDNLRRLATALKKPLLELTVAAGHMSPAEARMRDAPAPPSTPVGAGVDPELLAELAETAPEDVEKVRAYLRGIRDARR